MPNSPKTTEEKIEKMLNSWRTLAPDKTFAGLTLAQFEAIAEPCLAARRRIVELDQERAQEVVTRDRADGTFNAKAKQVVAGVLAAATEGPDSALYAGFGYTRESDHKSGLHRSKKKPPTT